MIPKFDLVIAFIGSAACNPVIHQLMVEHWDPRFFFSRWDARLIECLLRQQEEAGPEKRNVLILVDDVILTGPAEDQLSHMALRGRHFGISLIMCAVSYTTLPKKARRSLDALLVYSCPMQGDMKVLTWEFASHTSMAEHALRNLGDHTALVLETLERRQQLFLWKADLLTIQRTSSSPERDLSKSEPSSETRKGHQTACRQTGTSCDRNRTRSPERGPSSPHNVRVV